MTWDPDKPKRTADFQRRLAWWIVRRSGWILAVLLAVTAALASPLLSIRVAIKERGELPAGDRDLKDLEDFTQKFGGSEILLVIVRAPDVFTKPALDYLGVLTRALEAMPDVQGVMSLANADEAVDDGGGLAAVPFLGTVPDDPAALRSKRAAALAQPMWAGNLVSTGGTAAAVTVMLNPVVEEYKDRERVVNRVRDLLARTPPPAGADVHVTGLSSLMVDAVHCVRRDTVLLSILSPAAMGFILLLVFRTVSAAVAPLVVIPAAMAWTLGLFTMWGGTLNPVLSILTTLVAVVSLSNIVHVLTEYYRQARALGDRDAALVATLEHMFGACSMASVTTAVGFASLATARIRSVIQLGWWSAIGILISFVLVITLLPALLRLFPLPAARDAAARPPLMEKPLRALGYWLAGSGYRWTIAATYALAALAVAGILRLRVETDLAADLPPAMPSVQGLKIADRELSGIQNLEIALEGPPGTFKEPWAVRTLDDLGRRVAGFDGVVRTTSLADVLRLVNLAPGSAPGSAGDLPPTKLELGECLLLLSGSEMSSFLNTLVTPDYAAARLTVRLGTMSTRGYTTLLKQVEDLAASSADKRLRVRTTGGAKLAAAQVSALVRSQLNSLGYSLVATMIMITLYLGSLRSGWVCLPPNLAPIFVTFGMMGWAGIALNHSTVMTAAVAFGMVVDNTIHLIVRYRRRLTHHEDPREAVASALGETGPAMASASMIVAAGFSVLLVSAFLPVRQFGLLIAFTMIVALFADLMLTPALLHRNCRK